MFYEQQYAHNRRKPKKDEIIDLTEQALDSRGLEVIRGYQSFLKKS